MIWNLIYGNLNYNISPPFALLRRGFFYLHRAKKTPGCPGENKGEHMKPPLIIYILLQLLPILHYTNPVISQELYRLPVFQEQTAF